MNRFAALLCLVVGNTVASYAQTVTVDFGNRDASTHAIPSGFLGATGIGSSLSNPDGINLLKAAGVTDTRFWLNFYQVFSKGPADFTLLDSQLGRMQAAGIHPMAVMFGTPPSLGKANCAPPSDNTKWGALAATVVAHIDAKFPGVVTDYEIWNEPDATKTWCPANPATAEAGYVSLYAAAAKQMHDQAVRDGKSIHIGGPALAIPSRNLGWIDALTTNPGTAPYVDFISIHIYETGQTDIANRMAWPLLLAKTQASPNGLAGFSSQALTRTRAGKQPNAASTPVYITEYNDNWAFVKDCCRNDSTYGPLYNSVAIADFLNAAVSKVTYFAASSNGSYFCLVGNLDANMDCNTAVFNPYPQYYSFKLFANTLGLEPGGHLAKSIAGPANLVTTAFYTDSGNSVVVVNPTASPVSTTVAFNQPGLVNVQAHQYLLNQANSKITASALSLSQTATGYSASVSIPAYSTLGLQLQGGLPSVTKALMVVTSTRAVTVDSSTSVDSSGPIVHRTIDFGDGFYQSNTPVVTHTYAAAGTYTITLSVLSPAGQRYTSTSTVTVP